MPNPLSRVAPRASIIYGNIGDNPLAHNPELAFLAMQAIATWSDVEQFMLRLYVTLAGGAKSDAAALFLALESDGPKNQAINTLAERKLDKQNQAVLATIQKLASTQYKKRNALAHQTWGWSPNLTDALLLVDPRVTVVWDFHDNDKEIRDHVMVYKKPELLSIIKDNQRVAGMGMMFTTIISPSQNPRILETLSQKLYSEPEIAEKLLALKDKD